MLGCFFVFSSWPDTLSLRFTLMSMMRAHGNWVDSLARILLRLLPGCALGFGCRHVWVSCLHRSPSLAICKSLLMLPARILRLLATNHIFIEVSPDVFANNRLFSVLDTGKSVEELLARLSEAPSTIDSRTYNKLMTSVLHRSTRLLSG